MRKWFILGSLFVLTIILAACGKSNGEKEDKEITIAASPAPMASYLNMQKKK